MKTATLISYRVALVLCFITALDDLVSLVQPSLLASNPAIESARTWIGLGMSIYCLIALNRVLVTTFPVPRATIYVSVLIFLNIFGIALLEFGAPLSLSTVSLVALGLVRIVFGWELLRWRTPFGILSRVYALAMIVDGITLLSLLLLFFAVYFGAVLEVILGLIFFQVDKITRSPIPPSEVATA